jgi:hypothetical protein
VMNNLSCKYYAPFIKLRKKNGSNCSHFYNKNTTN